MHRPTRLLVPLLVVAGLAAVGCGGGSKGTTSSAGGTSKGTVSIKDFSFKPKDLKVDAKSTLKVTNNDSTTHTMTADDKSFDTDKLSGGATKSITVSKAGDISYHCEIHDYMKGVIHVENR